MAKKFLMSANRVQLLDGAAAVLDTDTKSFNAVPGAVLTVNPFTIAYPDFSNKSVGYQYDWGQVGGQYYEACRTIGSVGAQETALPDIDLGALPDGTDYLETRMKVSRTTSPPKILEHYDWPTTIVPNQWMQIISNSMVLEHYWSMSRMFSIIIKNGRAVLRRKQSVGTWGIQTLQIDWREQILPGGAGTQGAMDRGGSKQCSTNNYYSYASTYTGILEITPCSYRSPS